MDENLSTIYIIQIRRCLLLDARSLLDLERYDHVSCVAAEYYYSLVNMKFLIGKDLARMPSV